MLPSSLASTNVITASDAKTVIAVSGLMVSEPPEPLWTREPIHSAASGPPVHRLMATRIINAPSTTRLGQGATGSGASSAFPSIGIQYCIWIQWRIRLAFLAPNAVRRLARS